MSHAALSLAGPASRGTIETLRAGVLSGTITCDTGAEVEHLVVAVNGRPIGPVSIDWRTDDARRGTWRFDARRLPPDLLLDDRLAFEIRRQRAADTGLDTMEIETCRLLPVEALPRGRGVLEGYVDATDGIVRGWVWDPTRPQRRVSVQLFIDGVFCGLADASQSRPDLAATGRGDGSYGFAIAARAFLAKAGPSPTVRVLSLEPEVWTLPFAPHMRADQRRWFVPPRLHRIPETTRELVAILASAEPFPKKAYVIDRLIRKMPDAFSADYILLAVESLRVEMVKVAAPPPRSWDEHLVSWWRQRVIRAQIRRLGALADAAATTQRLLDAQSGATPVVQTPPQRQERHARP